MWRASPSAQLDGLIVRATGALRAAQNASTKEQIYPVLLELLDTQERLQLRAYDDVPADARAAFTAQVAGASRCIDAIEDFLAKWGQESDLVGPRRRTACHTSASGRSAYGPPPSSVKPG